jgi:hypothetical protein
MTVLQFRPTDAAGEPAKLAPRIARMYRDVPVPHTAAQPTEEDAR